CCAKNGKFASKHARGGSRHWPSPRRIRLDLRAIVDDGPQKRVSRNSAERIVTDFPIKAALPSQQSVGSQALKWEHAGVPLELLQRAREENIEIKIGPPKW